MRAESWVRRRWQLVRIEQASDALVVDLIELADDPDDSPGGLITLAFAATHPDGDVDSELRRQLERWRDQENGLCDAFHRPAEPVGCLAMFQGSDSLVIATGSLS